MRLRSCALLPGRIATCLCYLYNLLRDARGSPRCVRGSENIGPILRFLQDSTAFFDSQTFKLKLSIIPVKQRDVPAGKVLAVAGYRPHNVRHTSQLHTDIATSMEREAR